jgi:hypothetical protein
MMITHGISPTLLQSTTVTGTDPSNNAMGVDKIKQLLQTLAY